MHDEAVTNAVPVMNQMTIGLDFLNKTLGLRPQVGWHIGETSLGDIAGVCTYGLLHNSCSNMHTDPFGHSAFTPYLYSAMEYKAFILNRIPDPLKQVKCVPPWFLLRYLCY